MAKTPVIIHHSSSCCHPSIAIKRTLAGVIVLWLILPSSRTAGACIELAPLTGPTAQPPRIRLTYQLTLLRCKMIDRKNQEEKEHG